MDATTFRRLIDAIKYLTFAWSDISHAINNKACQHFNEPKFAHLKIAKRIFIILMGQVTLLFDSFLKVLSLYMDLVM